MNEVQIDAFVAVTMGFIVYFLGAFLTRKVAFLRNYNIPEPVSGGLAVALGTWLYFVVTGSQIIFDLAVRDYLLVVFFATIGLNARIADLFKGGRLLIILLGLTVGFMLLQNVVGLVGTVLFDLPTPVAVLLGSAALIGGHGTAIAWGPKIQEATGFAAAAEIGIASATLGLVFAALIGGPIAKFLIDRNKLRAEEDADPIVGLEFKDEGTPDGTVDQISLMRSMLTIHIAILLGAMANIFIAEAGLDLPLFVPCLLVGIIMSNTIPYIFPRLIWPARSRSLAVVSDYSLSVFLAMSLMSMNLGSLAELGAPLMTVLALQVLMTVTFIMFVVFRVLGGNYQAAVLSAGFAGFSLGATPTAIANMSSVTKRYGAAPLAFIVLPLVSAFFVDLANAFIIKFFVGL
ncbi:MAG: sodium/glutamate symporter [Rhodobacteraceae bacterium]|nr:sodium/glutamate symporter [Paracoccaceae bacterium]